MKSVGRNVTKWTRWLDTWKSDVMVKSIIEYWIAKRLRVRDTTRRRSGTRRTDQDEWRGRIPTDSFRSESFSHRFWNLENWSDHLKEIAFDSWNSTDTHTRLNVWRSLRLRSQKLKRIHRNSFVISDGQNMRTVSFRLSKSVRILHHEDYDHYHFWIFLRDDIETLQSPRTSDESKISNADTCISLHSIFIVSFTHTSVHGSSHK